MVKGISTCPYIFVEWNMVCAYSHTFYSSFLDSKRPKTNIKRIIHVTRGFVLTCIPKVFKDLKATTCSNLESFSYKSIWTSIKRLFYFLEPLRNRFVISGFSLVDFILDLTFRLFSKSRARLRVFGWFCCHLCNILPCTITNTKTQYLWRLGLVFGRLESENGE